MQSITQSLAGRVALFRLFQIFLGLCAKRAGQLLNLNALANEYGISQPTATCQP